MCIYDNFNQLNCIIMTDSLFKRFGKSVLLLLMLTVFAPATAKDVYGFMTGNGNNGEIPIGMYKYDTAGGTPELLTPLSFQFWGGAYANGRYMMILSDDATGYLTEGLCTYDLATKELKLRYSQQPYQCTDLTYDYSTSTLYGIMVKSGGEEVKPRLIQINTIDGSYTKVADLNEKLVALACTYYGDLYAMDGKSNLYELDKVSGELTLVGNTGVKCITSEAQSMEFDRATGELYWTGLDENEDTFFNKINPYTAEVVSSSPVENNSLIVGLYIPFTIADDKAPAKPLNLTATAGDSGVTLSWTNPSALYNGDTAEAALTKVEVWRNGKLIHTVENPVAGADETFVDKSEDLNGKVRYIVYAYNEAGRGEGASVKLMTGDDIPSAVENLTCSKSGNDVLLTWTAPTTGKNGGNVNPDKFVYTITRQPDGKVFENVKDTKFTDNTITSTCYYSWQVTCRNDVGESDAAKTATIAAGNSLTVPYTADFDTDLGCAQWLVVDNNGDGSTWITNGKGYVYNTSWTNAADDSLVSVPFHFEKGMKYVVNYDILAPDMFSTEHFEMSLVGNNGKQVLEDLKNFTTPDFSNPESRKVEFTVSETGDYQFYLAALSDAAQFMIQISAFSVEAVNEMDLKLDAFTSSKTLVAGEEAQFDVKVANNGTMNAAGYEVKILDADDHVLVSNTVKEELKAGEATTVVLAYTPEKKGSLALKAVVEAEGDDVAYNDTVKADFYVLDKDESVVAVGGRDCLTDYPFWFNGSAFNYAQMIYSADEIDHEACDITELDYDYINEGDDLTDKHIKVYLANTAKGSVLDGWMPEEQMELVVDGLATFRKGEHTLRLNLAKPFTYTGGNLCVMTVKDDSEKSDNISFYAAYTTDDEIRTALYYGEDSAVDMTQIKGAARIGYLGIVMKPNSLASIAGAASADEFTLVKRGNVLSLSNGAAAQFSVMTLAGKVVAVKKNAVMIDLSNMQKGIYIVNVEADGRQMVQKVVLQ